MIEYQPFALFLSTVQRLVAPEDLGEELTPFFRDQVGNALADIQTLIPWFRNFNVNAYTKEDVEEFCSASIFTGPVGKITQLFAYTPGRECKKYYYKRVSTSALDCWLERQRCVQCTFTPPPTHIYDTPYCNYVILGEVACNPPYLNGTEDTCRFTSLDDDNRIFAVGPDYRVYAAPRFPCGYSLFMQWQGIRRKWENIDLVPVDQQLREAVVNYVEHKIALKERNSVSMTEYYSLYAVNLRMLKYRYHDEQDTELERDCTSAIEQLMSAFAPAYGLYGVGAGLGVGDYIYSISGGGIIQVYTGATPPTSPDDPTQAAVFYPTGGGSIQQWDIPSQTWV